jgi:pyrroloquinoline-quinone synthase
MDFIEKLNQELETMHLLKHPFYQAWSEGELKLATLQVYAKEYYPHVAAFPRYISSIHSKCADIKKRQVLLGNLLEEEQGEENHPELWMRFAEGIGCERKEVEKGGEHPASVQLAKGYFDLTDQGFAEGLGALAVAKAKVEGLKSCYGIHNPSALQFFEVHAEADEWHTEEVAGLIRKLDGEEQKKVRGGALTGASLLWNFLDGMMAVQKSREALGSNAIH